MSLSGGGKRRGIQTQVSRSGRRPVLVAPQSHIEHNLTAASGVITVPVSPCPRVPAPCVTPSHRVLLTRIVLHNKALLEQVHVSLFEIKVRSPDGALTSVRHHPVNNLRCVRPQICTIVFVERLAILPRENPDVGILTVTNELKIPLKATQWRTLWCGLSWGTLG
jgi:hypothetical protein